MIKYKGIKKAILMLQDGLKNLKLYCTMYFTSNLPLVMVISSVLLLSSFFSTPSKVPLATPSLTLVMTIFPDLEE
jgi:sulfopyruvate decarboxylase TPP-binding subunit